MCIRDRLRGDPQAIGRCKVLVWPVVSFAAGCILGAYAYIGFGFAGLLVPCVVLACMAVATKD